MSERGDSIGNGASAGNGAESNGPDGTRLNPAAVDKMTGDPLRLYHWWDF